MDVSSCWAFGVKHAQNCMHMTYAHICACAFASGRAGRDGAGMLRSGNVLPKLPRNTSSCFLSKSHSFGYQYLEEATGILKQMGDTLSATPKFDDMVALLKHEQLDDDHCGAQFDLVDDKKKN